MIIAKVSSLIMKGGHGQTNRLHDTNWNALDHAYASRIISCNYIWLLDTLYRIIEIASNFQQKCKCMYMRIKCTCSLNGLRFASKTWAKFEHNYTRFLQDIQDDIKVLAKGWKGGGPPPFLTSDLFDVVFKTTKFFNHHPP